MLYANPRGISCVKCHGKDAKGRLIATYRSQGVVKKLIAPDITNVPKDRFKKAIKEGRGVMPSYFMTKKETDAIYRFVKYQNHP